jgi:hypothetical protein
VEFFSTLVLEDSNCAAKSYLAAPKPVQGCQVSI